MSIQCTRDSDAATVTFVADVAINDYHRPEIIGGNAVIRFVNTTLAANTTIASCQGVAITHEQIRDILVCKVDAGGLNKATVHRVNATTITLQVSPVSTPPTPKASTPAASGTSATRQWALDVIVIDAGHGGKDVGAKGVNGVFEKDVTLSIARKLRALVQEKLPGTKVVMTRDDDTFVELYRRTQIANEANGKLFVSIHCNSMPTIPHTANGCETYILRPGRNEDAAHVAERENASVRLEGSVDRYAGLGADQLIVATMAQRSFVRFSEELAAKIQQHVSVATGLQNRGVNQAGFFVLVGASMPNVLFETAFLSNPSDAEFISSTSGQNKIAEAMLTAIRSYSEVYEASLK